MLKTLDYCTAEVDGFPMSTETTAFSNFMAQGLLNHRRTHLSALNVIIIDGRITVISPGSEFHERVKSKINVRQLVLCPVVEICQNTAKNGLM